MEKSSDNHSQIFESATSMLDAVTGGEKPQAVVTANIRIKESAQWKAVVIGAIVVIGIALAGLGGAVDAISKILFLIGLLVGIPVLIYRSLKGNVNFPDALVITQTHVFLLKGVLFNRKKGLFSYNDLFKIQKAEIRERSLPIFCRIKFSVPRKLSVAAWGVRLRKRYRHLYPHLVSTIEARKLIFQDR